MAPGETDATSLVGEEEDGSSSRPALAVLTDPREGRDVRGLLANGAVARGARGATGGEGGDCGETIGGDALPLMLVLPSEANAWVNVDLFPMVCPLKLDREGLVGVNGLLGLMGLWKGWSRIEGFNAVAV
jgi:hypothetical protein